MALAKQHKNPFARRIQIVFTGLVIGSVVGVLSSPLNGLFVYAGLVAFLDVLRMLFAKKPSTNFEKYINRVSLCRVLRFGILSSLYIGIHSFNFSEDIFYVSFSVMTFIFFISNGVKFGYPVKIKQHSKNNYTPMGDLAGDRYSSSANNIGVTGSVAWYNNQK